MTAAEIATAAELADMAFERRQEIFEYRDAGGGPLDGYEFDPLGQLALLADIVYLLARKHAALAEGFEGGERTRWPVDHA